MYYGNSVGGVKPAKPDRNMEQQLHQRLALPERNHTQRRLIRPAMETTAHCGKHSSAATPGEIDGAASFNGSTANIQTPLNINALPITSAWVNPANTGVPGAPWSTDNGGWDYAG